MTAAALPVHPVAVLPDGTPAFVPPGTVRREDGRVQCHLCGQWYRSVAAHLRAHGWERAAYREAFGLERTESLEGSDTRARRATAMRRRLATDPTVQAGSALGHASMRSGRVTRVAATAARGRPQPEQRRRKTLRSLAAISPEARAEGTRRAAQERLRAVAAEAAAGLGFPDVGALVRARVAAGASLAAVSRECGLHKDWLCRHLAAVDPQAARDVAGPAVARLDVPWTPVLRRAGFAGVRDYLVDRHGRQRWTVAAIAAEAGVSRGAVQTAMRRHGVPVTAHATSRAAQGERAAEVAARFGFPDIAGYLADRRAAGRSWRVIAAECGRPATWVRRQAGLGLRPSAAGPARGRTGPSAGRLRLAEEAVDELQHRSRRRVPPGGEDGREAGVRPRRTLGGQRGDDRLQDRPLPV